MILNGSLALMFALSWTTQAPDDDPRVRAIAPFVGEEVAVVVALDLEGLDVESLSRRLLAGFAEAEDVDPTTRSIGRWFAALRGAGAKQLFLLAGPAATSPRFVAVVPLTEGADARAIGRILCGEAKSGADAPPLAWPTCATIHDAVLAGTAADLERVPRSPVDERPGLAAAFSAAGEAPARLLIVPSDDQVRILEEMLPTLPGELGGGPIATFTRGMRWAAVALDSGPRPTVRVVVQSADPVAAGAFRRLCLDAFGLIAKSAAGPRPLPAILEGLARLQPEVSGNRVILSMDPDRAASLAGLIHRKMWRADRRARCVNNLKQIGLAMHNYHQKHDAFPPSASRDPEGRPLLSWRVQLLPYLEQQALYDEFHLDEPWDSPHNKELIPRMPALFACPEMRRSLRASGRTTYLAPVGPSTAFPGDRGVSYKEMTDGTSNTILVVEAGDDQAVPWTQPADWEVGDAPSLAPFVGHHLGGTEVIIADGSVKFLKGTLPTGTLRALLTRAGGEVISADDL